MPACRLFVSNPICLRSSHAQNNVRAASRTAQGLRSAGFLLLLAFAHLCSAQPKDPCPRFAPGSTVVEPVALFSSNGVLKVDLSYNTSLDENGNPKFCFITPDGTESPTLHVRPGDHLIINVKSNLPAPSSGSMVMEVTGPNVCKASVMNNSSVNIHYHGTNTSPVCGQDEVIHTVINSGESYTYNVAFPTDEPGRPAGDASIRSQN